MEVVEIATPRGPARAHVHRAPGARAMLVLGHGAGGSITAPDLQAAAATAMAADVSVALVEQPYRVAGRRSAAPAAHLDEAWSAVVAELRRGPLAGLVLVTGGRSSGARVACRTAVATGAAGVLCLAFPLHPPGRPEKSRLGELDGAGVPVLVVQGRRDPFGVPSPGPSRELLLVDGDHSLRRGVEAMTPVLGEWLGRVARARMAP